ncbi:MAG: hypothetical protein R3C32_13915 [Chloroflexota bacterium]
MPRAQPVADYETEPNDTPATATPFDASVTMCVVAWRMAMPTPTASPSPASHSCGEWMPTAPLLSSLDWVDGSGSTLGTGIVADDKGSATLYDLYLGAGEHRIQVVGEGGDYTLTATPMGPPDPDAEREPNDDRAHANRIGVGDTRTGRLRASDLDRYRLSSPRRSTSPWTSTSRTRRPWRWTWTPGRRPSW